MTCLHSQLAFHSSCTAATEFTEVIERTTVCLVNSSAYLIGSCPPLPLICLVPPQCTQGTKGLLESATRSPLLPTSCPQGKPQTARTCPGSSPAVNSDLSRELSANCGARHTAGSQSDASPPRHGKSGLQKNKRAALHIPNPAFDDPVSHSTALESASSSKGSGHKGAVFSSLH